MKIYFSAVFGLTDIVWHQNIILDVKLPKTFDNWINFKIAVTKIEATQAKMFGEEENTKSIYLSGKILKLTFSTGWCKKYQKAMNIQWFCRKVYFFFVFDNYLHNLCINLIFKGRIPWIDQLSVVFFFPGYIF